MTNRRKKTIRTLIVEDSKFLIEGLAIIINAETGMEIVGMANTCAECLSLVRKENPDLVLLDIILNDENGIEIIPDLVNKTSSKVLIMTGINDFAVYEDAMLQGVGGIVVKEDSSAVLLEAIKKVAAGEIWLSDTVRHRISQPRL